VKINSDLIIEGTSKSLKELQEQVDKLTPVNLYYNYDGTTGNVTLNDDVNNYNYIEIFFRNNDNYYNSTRIYMDKPTDQRVYLGAHHAWGSGSVFTKMKIIQISGNKMNVFNSYYSQLELRNNTVILTQSNNIYITRVDGYKK